MTATITFSLVDAIGRGLGLALLCPDARYASIAWRGADRLDRRFIAAKDWRSVEQDVRDGFPPTVLPPDHVLTRVFAGDRPGVTVQYLSQQPIALVPATAAAQLDAHLRQQALAAPPH